MSAVGNSAMSDVEKLRAVRVKLADLYNATPQRYESRRRFLGRLDRTVLIIIGELTGNILDANSYDSIAAEFDSATGRVKKLKDELENMTKSVKEARDIVDTIGSIFSAIPRPR